MSQFGGHGLGLRRRPPFSCAACDGWSRGAEAGPPHVDLTRACMNEFQFIIHTYEHTSIPSYASRYPNHRSIFTCTHPIAHLGKWGRFCFCRCRCRCCRGRTARAAPCERGVPAAGVRGRAGWATGGLRRASPFRLGYLSGTASPAHPPRSRCTHRQTQESHAALPYTLTAAPYIPSTAPAWASRRPAWKLVLAAAGSRTTIARWQRP